MTPGTLAPGLVAVPGGAGAAAWSRPETDLRTADFDYDLPPDLVAQVPADPRDASRLLVIDRATGGISHRAFRDLPGLLDPGDVLVVNDSRVIAARMHVRRATGGRVELLLLRPVLGGGGLPEDSSLRPSLSAYASPPTEALALRGMAPWSPWWEALVRPANRARAAETLVVEVPEDEGRPRAVGEFAGSEVRAEVGGRLPSGGVAVRFDAPVDAVTARFGEMPLPPYVRERLADGSRYQTVYAREAGSAAAPTAGLHFTPALLDAVRARGVEVVPVTLHVGADTFLPVRADRIADHPMHAEYAVVPDATAAAIARARRAGRRVTCVGTTAVRATESWARARFASRDRLPDVGWHGWTRLFLYPGAPFFVVDAMVTNFHVPRSTLLMLVSAFAGSEVVRAAYATAIEARYRFYSLGDACLFR
jgi:S-adenosylmethionine:tRNA ribosyltransferase-isomerase